MNGTVTVGVVVEEIAVNEISHLQQSQKNKKIIKT
jgi:hypothetical protein